MEEVVAARGYSFEIILSNSFFKPTFSNGILRSPRILFELDAKYGVFGDSLAGLLLSPLEYIDPSISDLVDSYRSSVVAEEAIGIKSMLGLLSTIISVKPELYIISRMVKLSELYGAIYSNILERRGLEALSYARKLIGLGKPRRLYSRFYKIVSSSLAHKMELSDLIREYRLLDAPRGLVRSVSLSESLDNIRIAELYTGDSIECTRLSILYSVYKCVGSRGTVIVKDYRVSSTKWIPAFLASAPTVRYRVDYRERALAELIYTKLIGRIIRTPEIIALHLGRASTIAVKEHIHGSPLVEESNPKYWSIAGRALAKIHLANYSLGDANPSNFIVDDSIALVDLEQARRASIREKAWDIVTVIAYSHLLGLKSGLLESMLKTYSDTLGEDTRILAREFKKIKYWIPYTIMPYMLPVALSILRRVGLLE
ncbi:MAG: hypothetical protein QXO93_06160 [Acidilobaceae archaeon]